MLERLLGFYIGKIPLKVLRYGHLTKQFVISGEIVGAWNGMLPVIP
jgi:hypothetical protein